MQIIIKSSFLSLIFLLFSMSLRGQDEMKSWHHQGADSAFPTGIGSAEWYNSAPLGASKKVIVAIIDSGVDIDHPDLKNIIWKNPGEIPGNKKDDDGNGYVDDVSGWNFLGGPDGTSVVKEALEVTRLFGKERSKWENVDATKLKGKKKKAYAEFLKMKEVVETKQQNALEHIEKFKQVQETVMKSLQAAKEELKGDTIDLARLEKSENPDVQTAAKVIRNVEDQGIKVENIDWLMDIAKEQFLTQAKEDDDDLNYSYNPNYNARTIIGDKYTDFENRSYGNNLVNGEFSYHGTHVSGIIGAQRNNGEGMDGIADNVALMVVKTVPDGDERD